MTDTYTINKKVKSTKSSVLKFDVKRNELLDEAIRVLNRRGVSQNSLRLIAKNVGISRAALYYYVDDLRDLVFQCYVRTFEQLATILEVSCDKYTGAPEIVDYFIAQSLNEKRPEFASLSEVAFLNEDQRNQVLDLYTGVRGSLADVITLGISTGQFRPCHPRIIASVILGLISWISVAMRWSPETVENYLEFKNTISETLKIGIANKRTDVGLFNRFDLSSFFTHTGNIFDPQARVSARRESLLLVASWLFNQKGTDATSLEQVAAEVGVTKKVIYHNIGGKDKLVTDCYRRAFNFFRFVGEKAMEYDGDRLDALCMSLTTLASASVRKDIAPMVPLTGHDAWPKDVRQDLKESVLSLTERGQVIYKKGMQENSIRNINSRAILMLRPGYYEWMTRWGNSLTESELQLAPQELTKLYRLGLMPLDPE